MSTITREELAYAEYLRQLPIMPSVEEVVAICRELHITPNVPEEARFYSKNNDHLEAIDQAVVQIKQALEAMGEEVNSIWDGFPGTYSVTFRKDMTDKLSSAYADLCEIERWSQDVLVYLCDIYSSEDVDMIVKYIWQQKAKDRRNG